MYAPFCGVSRYAPYCVAPLTVKRTCIAFDALPTELTEETARIPPEPTADIVPVIVMVGFALIVNGNGKTTAVALTAIPEHR